MSKKLSKIELSIYLAILLIFVLFPRPILESSNPDAIREFMRTHANLFYKILYADTHLVALGNYLMLTPLPIFFKLSFPHISYKSISLIGISLSGSIELIQNFIPGRVPDFVDFASNSLSVVIGIGLWMVTSKIRQLFSSKQA